MGRRFYPNVVRHAIFTNVLLKILLKNTLLVALMFNIEILFLYRDFVLAWPQIILKILLRTGFIVAVDQPLGTVPAGTSHSHF